MSQAWTAAAYWRRPIVTDGNADRAGNCWHLHCSLRLPEPTLVRPVRTEERLKNMTPIPSILVIDDNAEMLSILAELLTALGAQKVRQVTSAEEALDVLQQERFTIILSDYRLEGMDGVQFVEHLRQTGDRTPVIMLSGAPDKPGVIRATRQELVDFFPKPFRSSDLACAMDRLLAA
jgi:CheY-like chemotaxis protein